MTSASHQSSSPSSLSSQKSGSPSSRDTMSKAARKYTPDPIPEQTNMADSGIVPPENSPELLHPVPMLRTSSQELLQQLENAVRELDAPIPPNAPRLGFANNASPVSSTVANAGSEFRADPIGHDGSSSLSGTGLGVLNEPIIDYGGLMSSRASLRDLETLNKRNGTPADDDGVSSLSSDGDHSDVSTKAVYEYQAFDTTSTPDDDGVSSLSSDGDNSGMSNEAAMDYGGHESIRASVEGASAPRDSNYIVFCPVCDGLGYVSDPNDTSDIRDSAPSSACSVTQEAPATSVNTVAPKPPMFQLGGDSSQSSYEGSGSIRRRLPGAFNQSDSEDSAPSSIYSVTQAAEAPAVEQRTAWAALPRYCDLPIRPRNPSPRRAFRHPNAAVLTIEPRVNYEYDENRPLLPQYRERLPGYYESLETRSLFSTSSSSSGGRSWVPPGLSNNDFVCDWVIMGILAVMVFSFLWFLVAGWWGWLNDS